MKDIIVNVLAGLNVKPAVFLAIQLVLLGILYVIRNGEQFGADWTIPDGYVTALEWITTILSALISAKYTTLQQNKLT